MFMESDRNTNYSQNNSGLLRYRSAPSYLLENYASRVEESSKISGSNFRSDEENCMSEMENCVNSNNRSGVSRIGAVNSQLPPQYPRQSDGGQFGYLAVNLMDMDHVGPTKMGSGLMRQNSYPAGLFSHLNSQNGFSATRGIGNYNRMADDGDLSSFSSRFKNNMDLSSSRISSSLGMLSPITEVENENGFPFDSWNGSMSSFTENFTTTNIKREFDSDHENLYADQTQNEENEPHTLSRHLSLPKTSANMAAMEKLLQLQDSVPCKFRAKRGFATHPRSIAERGWYVKDVDSWRDIYIRRTKISERMRKLQDLVPNMDKQTNTADMLDLTVDYIKNLQQQYKKLSENRANCNCYGYEKTGLNQ